jgi:MYXO-CTERM domain-containing protein
LVATVALSLAAVGLSSPARACGGTFCDSAPPTTPPPPTQTGPVTMSVDQRGENILFVLDGKSVETHIQIQYQGDAAHFAWVIPVPAIPAFEIGSQALFDRLLSTTVPSYGYGTRTGCPVSGTAGVAPGGSGAQGTDPQVVYKAAVGAYEIHVISGTKADDVQQWLVDHGYAPSADAPPILQEYLEEGYLFAAVKLQNGVGVDQIHPIVIKVPGDKPCVPLRLTRVAAVEDMAVRAFFLADRRAVPTNYKHVTLNPVWLDWTSYANNYDDVVSAAVDAPVADGHAFVTEYAGTSTVARMPTVTWTSTAFESIAPENVVAELTKQGLASCYQTSCQFAHPLITPILHQFLPVPAGMTDAQFYSALPTHKLLIDAKAWDAAGFAGAFAERIEQPALHAASVVNQHPYLTRLLTHISPSEMTEDPEFALRSDLGGVGNTHVGSLDTSCGCASMSLPGGRKISVAANIAYGQWPVWGPDMPYVERIEDFSTDGAPITLVNETAKIDEVIAQREAGIRCVGTPTNGFGGSSAGYPYGAGGMGHGFYGNDTYGSTSDGPACACTVGRRTDPASVTVAAIALGLLAQWRRRRSRAAR